MLFHAMKQPGDRIDHGNRVTRYAMDGDTYMNGGRIGDLADDLYQHASRIGRPDWLPQIAVRLGLAHPGVSLSEAAMILGAAQVTWDDIRWMKS